MSGGDGGFRKSDNIQHRNIACNIEPMVHYHQQALQNIMLADVFLVFFEYNYCHYKSCRLEKQPCKLSLVETSGPFSRSKDVVSFLILVFFFPFSSFFVFH